MSPLGAQHRCCDGGCMDFYQDFIVLWGWFGYLLELKNIRWTIVFIYDCFHFFSCLLTFVVVRYYDDNVAFFVSFFYITVCFGHFFQRIDFVYHGLEFSGFN